MVAEREGRGHIHAPIAAVIGDTGCDLEHPADNPLDGPFDLFTHHTELA